MVDLVEGSVVGSVVDLVVDWVAVWAEVALLQLQLHPAYLVNSSRGQCLVPPAASEQDWEEGWVHWEEVEEEPCFRPVSAACS